MSSQMRVVMTGDEQKLFQSLQNIINQSDKADDSFAKNAKTSTEAEKAALRAAKAQAKSAREGAKLADELSKKNESLNDSYKRRKAAIEAAGAAGVKSEEEVRVAVGRLKKAVMEEARVAKQAETEKAESARKGTKAYKDQQDEIRKGITKVNQLKAANKTLDQQYDELRRAIKATFKAGQISAGEYKRSLKQLQTEQDELARKQRKGFGPKAIAMVKEYGAALVGAGGLAAAWKGVAKVIEFYNQEKDKAIGNTESLVESRTALRQISKGDFDKMSSEANALASDPAIGITQAQANDLKFAARSTGFEGKENERLVAMSDRVIPMEQSMKMAGGFRQQFVKEGLSVENAMDTFLAASVESVFNSDQLTPQIQKAAQGSKAIGASSSDVAAVTGVFAAQFGESSGQRVRMLQENLFAKKDMGFQGAGLIGSIEKLRDSMKLRSEFVDGNKELGTAVNAAINSLQDFKLDGKSIAGIYRTDKAIEIAQTDESRPLMKRIAEASDPTTLSGKIENARRSDIAETQRNLIAAEEEYAEIAFLTNAEKSKLATSSLNRKDPLLQQTGGSIGAWAGGRVGGPGSVRSGESFMRNLLGDFGFSELSDARSREDRAIVALAKTTERLAEMQADAADRQDKNMEKLIENTSQQPSTLPLSEPGVDR